MLCPYAIPGHFDPSARGRALRASSYKTHTRIPFFLSFFLTCHGNGCTRSLLLRAEWALVDEILTSENRNPLRDLQRGSLLPSPPLFSYRRMMERWWAERAESSSGKRKEKRREKAEAGSVVFSMNLKGVGREWRQPPNRSFSVRAISGCLCVRLVRICVHVTRTKSAYAARPTLRWLADWGG